MSPKVILVALVGLHLALSFFVDMLSYPGPILTQTMLQFLLVFGLSVVGWYLTGWRDQLSRWYALALLTLALAYTVSNLRTPALLPWMALVPVIALSLISFSAAVLMAVVCSGLLFVLCGLVGSEFLVLGANLLMIWVAVGISYAAVHPLHRRIAWLHEYFDEARLQVEDVRKRRAAYEQALEDLTHANRQLVLMNQRVAGLRQIAEDAQKSKTRFVARVSHEFRTPLNMIIGLVDLMVTSPEIYDVALSPRMREALRVVHRNCEHLSDMVDDVLDLTRIEMDRVALHRERVDLAEIIQSAVEAVSPLLADKGLELRTQFPSDVPEVYCDRTRIEQVVLNLVSNATRHTDEGGITVRIVEEKHRVRISVSDTGTGIRPEDVDRIFEPFSQGTAELWRDRGGSGLGLSISKQFVELHKGRMWVESELGVGTTFSFDLPINPALGPVARPGHQIREDWIWRERRSRPSFPDVHYVPRFVVCDETGDLEPFLASWAEKVEFVPLPNLDAVRATLREVPVHAVLLNGRDLDQLWEEVEAIQEVAAATPVIGCSIVRNDGRARSLGVLGHLVKPVRRQDFASALEAVGSDVHRVLVVDDEPDALQLFSEVLHACNASLEILQAQDGAVALDQLRRATPDLMLLDLVMPHTDGWQVLEAMANDENVPSVPTFLISAQDPRDQLTRSGFLLVSAAGGLSLNSVVELSLMSSELLLGSDHALESGPEDAPRNIPDQALR
ncbi:MAG: ATP-binding response regulator [Anaerolineae bacterium]